MPTRTSPLTKYLCSATNFVGRFRVILKDLFLRHNTSREGGSHTSKKCCLVLRLVKKFRDTRSVHDLGRPGRPQGIRIEDAVELHVVQSSVEEDPQTSTRRRSSDMLIAKSSLHRILKTDLVFSLTRFKWCMLFSRWWLATTIWVCGSCERTCAYWSNFRPPSHHVGQSSFSTDRLYELKQNCRFWDENNPRELLQRQLHPQKIFYQRLGNQFTKQFLSL